MLRPGDVVIGMDRPVISSGVKVAKVKVQDTPSLLVQRVGRLVNYGVLQDYLYYLLCQGSFKEHLLSLQTGTELPHVSATDILSFPVPLAPLKEQRALIGKIEKLFAEADQVEGSVRSALRNANTLEQSILEKAFGGELIQQDPNDEPASVLLKRIRANRPVSGKRKESHAVLDTTCRESAGVSQISRALFSAAPV